MRDLQIQVVKLQRETKDKQLNIDQQADDLKVLRAKVLRIPELEDKCIKLT